MKLFGAFLNDEYGADTMAYLNKFLNDESGAVTVDWVVLTAAIVGLGVAVMTTVGGGTTDYAQTISSHMATRGIVTTY